MAAIFDPQTLPYRQSVGLCLLNKTGKVLVAERRDQPGAWQMPQGGIQKGEEPHHAVKREMKEEIGTNNAIIIARVEEPLRYDFPDAMNHKGGIFRGKYRGQQQHWFALLFQGQDDEIDLSGEHEPESPEFTAWRWEELETTPQLIVPFKRPVYEQVVMSFMPIVQRLRQGERLIPVMNM